MKSAMLSASLGHRQIRDFAHTLRKLTKCPYIYVADTDRCGLGIFAAKSFKRGEFLIIDLDGDYYDQVLSYSELQKLDINVDVTLQVGLDAYKLPTGSLEDFTNHSCDPNTGIKLIPKGTVVVALRAIPAHEEITYDYSTYLNNPYEKMDCLCGAGNCRGLIGNFKTLPVSLKKKYLELGIVGDFATATFA